MTTYYVDATSGSNGNAGTSSGAPWQTLAKVAGSSFTAGDSILLKRGETWNEALAFPSSGNSGAWITLGAYGSGADPIVDSQNTRATGIDVSARNYIDLQDLDLRNATSQNVLFGGSGNQFRVTRGAASGSGDQDYQCPAGCTVVFTDGSISDAADDGISRHNGSTITVSGTTFSGNHQDINDDGNTGGAVTVTDCVFDGNTGGSGDSHILVRCAATVSRCTFVFGDGYNRSIETPANGSVYSYCTWIFTGTGSTDQLVKGPANGSTVTFNNCVFYATNSHKGRAMLPQAGDTFNLNNCILVNFDYAYWRAYAATINATNCIYYGLTATSTGTTGTLNETACVTDDPEFVTPGSNFRLLSTSPAINAGVDLSLTEDIEGNSIVGVPDIGAYEYQSGRRTVIRRPA